MRITICGKPGTGTSTLLKQLEQFLHGYEVHSCGDLMRQIAKDAGFDNVGEYTKSLDDDEEPDLLVDMRVGELAVKHENLVIEGRIAHLAMLKFGKRQPDLKILLYCDPDIAAERVAEREGISLGDARIQNSRRDEDDMLRFEAGYGYRDVYGPVGFHLCINTGVMDQALTAQVVASAIRSVDSHAWADKMFAQKT